MSTSSKSTILLLRGTGRISSHIAPLLSHTGYTTLLGSSSGSVKLPSPDCHGVKFDWFDSSTWSAPFANQPIISAIFLVAPPILECVSLMKSFINLAIVHKVKRLVLLFESSMDVGDGSSYGQIPHYVAELGVEYAILSQVGSRRTSVSSGTSLRFDISIRYSQQRKKGKCHLFARRTFRCVRLEL